MKSTSTWSRRRTERDDIVEFEPGSETHTQVVEFGHGRSTIVTTLTDITTTTELFDVGREDPRVAFDWPLSAQESSTKARPSAAIRAVAPGIERVLTNVDHEMTAPSRHDYPIDATQQELGVIDAEWSERDTGVVRSLLSERTDSEVKRSIKQWGGLWPHQFSRWAETTCPDFVRALHEAHRSDPRFRLKRERHRERWIEHALSIGLWHIYRINQPWPAFDARTCQICSRRFAPETLWSDYELTRSRLIVCRECVGRSISPHDRTDLDIRVLLNNLADQLGFLPSSRIHDQHDLISGAADPVSMMALFIALPAVRTLKEMTGAPDNAGAWLHVLQSVGLVGQSQKLSRGIRAFASDGHLCRSMGELSIERFLIERGIWHECEPHYPADDELNPNGKMRADWLLKGGVHVEYAGMLDDAAYKAKMDRKRRLARRYRIALIVLTPDDLPTLNETLGDFVVRFEQEATPNLEGCARAELPRE